jgi:predicted CXXCH cytochrome family protein
MVMADYYRQSRHAETFTMLGAPGCATCHQNHDVQEAEPELLGLDEGAVCSRCHTAEDRGGGVAQAMRGQLDSLELEFEVARTILERAEHAGMEVSQALFELEAATNAQVAARAAVHSFDLDAVTAEIADGLEITSAGRIAGETALDELGFRRTGLAISVVIILALIAGLLLRIRQIERHP